LNAVLLAWLACAAFFDLRYRRVPNWMALSGLLLALAALGLGMQPLGIGWAAALSGAAAAFVVLLLFYVTSLIGAGDVKFAGALGLWVGLQALLPIWIGASLLAGLHGLVAWARRREPGQKRKRDIPYAAYMAVATVGWMAWRQLAV
jgi:prepilin peptidase CpaA